MTAQDPIQPSDAELMEILREMFRAIIARGKREHLLRQADWDPDAIRDEDTDEEREATALDDPMDRAHYWRGVVLRNAYEEIRPYTEAALRRRNRATPEPDERHRAFLRMAAGVAAEAHTILGERRMGRTRKAEFPYEGWPGPSEVAQQGTPRAPASPPCSRSTPSGSVGARRTGRRPAWRCGCSGALSGICPPPPSPAATPPPSSAVWGNSPPPGRRRRSTARPPQRAISAP
jgi:hypothetical protein